MSRLLMVAIVAGTVFTSLRAQPARSDKASAAEQRYTAALNEFRAGGVAGPAVKAFFDALPHVDGYLVIEGDVLMTDAEAVQSYLAPQAAAAAAAFPPGPELKINVLPGGAFDLYAVTDRTLTYAVAKSSFPDAATYQQVVTNLAKATKAWEQACPTCKLKFTHLPNLDAAPSTAQANFVARSFDSQGQYIAASFFPHDPPARRFLNIDTSYFSTTFDHVGVLRHELGHVLGYRHEHIQGIPGCYLEDANWRPLTPYDKLSVMHYFCGGAGSLTLSLTKTDVRGHKLAYKMN